MLLAISSEDIAQSATLNAHAGHIRPKYDALQEVGQEAGPPPFCHTLIR